MAELDRFHATWEEGTVSKGSLFHHFYLIYNPLFSTLITTRPARERFVS
jgi:hypothetical protein